MTEITKKDIINNLNNSDLSKKRLISEIWESGLEKNEFGHYYITKSKKIKIPLEIINKDKEKEIQETKKQKKLSISINKNEEKRTQKTSNENRSKEIIELEFIINPNNEEQTIFKLGFVEEDKLYYSMYVELNIPILESKIYFSSEWSYVIEEYKTNCEIAGENFKCYEIISENLDKCKAGFITE